MCLPVAIRTHLGTVFLGFRCRRAPTARAFASFTVVNSRLSGLSELAQGLSQNRFARQFAGCYVSQRLDGVRICLDAFLAGSSQMDIAQALKNASGLWLLQVFKTLASFAVSLVTIRYLGPNNYGILATGSAVAILFSALGGLPQGELLIREMARAGRAALGKVISTAFVLQFVGSALLVLAAMAAVFILRYEAHVQIVVLLVSLAHMVRPVTVLMSTIEFDGQFGKKGWLEFAHFVFGAGTSLLLVAMSASVFWFAAFAIINAAVQAIFLLIFADCTDELAPIRSFSRPQAHIFLRDGWPLLLNAIAISIYLRTDVIFISKILGDASAGWYTAGIRFSEALFFFPMIILTIYQPTLSRKYVDDPAIYYRLVSNVVSAVFIVGTGLAFGLFVSAALGLPLLLGERFAQSVPIVEISAWTIILVGLSHLVSTSLILQHQTRVPFYGSLIGAGANIALNALLIPVLGIVGGIIATLMAQIISLGVMVGLASDRKFLLAFARGLSPAHMVSVGLWVGGEILGLLRRRRD